MTMRIKRQPNCLLLLICILLVAMRICWHSYKTMKINKDQRVKTEVVDMSALPSHPKIAKGITRDHQLSDEITLVTAYWNLGTFSKGSSSNLFDTKMYHRWANVFRYIMNPLVVYTDSREFSDLFNSLRNSTSHRTQIYIVNRNSSWAFKNIKRIREIYSSPGYPKHLPNTVLPEYACAQHAKYDVTVRAATENIYRTKYFAWIDIGYFRDRKSSKPFYLKSPDRFNDTLIAMNEVGKKVNYSTTSIFKRNEVWIGGGLFHGRHDVIIKFGAQFKRAVDYFLSQCLMNTDQQVIYAMFTKEGYTHIKQDVHIQTYGSKGDWFFLGKHMVKELDKDLT